MFEDALPDTKRQEMSREKLLSKLLMSIQSFTYSCCCEAFEARRIYRRIAPTTSDPVRLRRDASVQAVFSRYGISGIECDGLLIILPRPSSADDGGSQPFNGRLGKLRYLALAIMSAAGAIATDIIQLVMPFPTDAAFTEICLSDQPERAPIAYPLLFGHVMTHVTTAVFASCGRARALGDSIDTWQVPLASPSGINGTGLRSGSQRVDDVVDDCEGFVKLGLLARLMQVLLGRLQFPAAGIANASEIVSSLKHACSQSKTAVSGVEYKWMCACASLLEIALSADHGNVEAEPMRPLETKAFIGACALASDVACVFLSELTTIIQVLVPGFMARYDNPVKEPPTTNEGGIPSSYLTFERLRTRFEIESVGSMLESTLSQQVVANWYCCACKYARSAATPSLNHLGASILSDRLRRTQGFRAYDWPSAGVFDNTDLKGGAQNKDPEKYSSREHQPHDDAATTSPQVHRASAPSASTDMLRGETAPVLVTFSSKKSVPLLGGFSTEEINTSASVRPRVLVIPTSYTDLYAELGALMPDCEQTAVCLVCGEVLNAGGKGECTRHSYKCGAGAGMFFLLQECSGLIMHKSKAAYIHSPYVDSHGETPQYRGRPLNLDLDRYDHLREVWFGHGVRQQVVAERVSSRQVIMPDFY